MSMADTRWQRVNELFHAARERAVDDRNAFLARECGADSQLRVEVQSLLAAHDVSGSLAQPSLRSGARLGDYVENLFHVTIEGRSLLNQPAQSMSPNLEDRLAHGFHYALSHSG